MHISIVNRNKPYEVGDAIPSDLIDVGESNLPLEKEYILAPGDTHPDGDTVYITGDGYLVNDRTYDLGTGDGVMEAVICDNFIIPKLRRAFMSERYAFVKMVSKGPHLIEEPEGEVTDFWPIIEVR